ncbi:sporulation protein YpjB [Paenibacillus hamazuiensis]|uniref:sporulation protein YpjB n=1 Tax=Paenibacillus hamazuiensis TaxID=2936508 RepID=UPI00200DDAEB|nr:sporulation protein YpjB [Paenibacillus hamazuiensis]
MFFQGARKKGAAILVALTLVALLAGCNRDGAGTEQNATIRSEEQVKKIERLNELADDMYKKVQQGDIMGGRDSLQQVSDQLTQIHFEGITSVEGMHALTETVTQAKRVFNAVKFSPDEGQVSTIKLRLAVDALKSMNDPMWLQYYNVLQNDIKALEKGATEASRAETDKAFAGLYSHYGLIHPSLLISRSPTDVEKADSLVTFVQSQLASETEPYKRILSVIPEIRQMIDRLFHKKDTPAYLPIIDNGRPIIWSIGIGSAIIAALVYAGWRLFQKERGIIPVRRIDKM